MRGYQHSAMLVFSFFCSRKIDEQARTLEAKLGVMVRVREELEQAQQAAAESESNDASERLKVSPAEPRLVEL